jgi:hypothetical protein
MVGLPDAAVKEAKDRVESAIKNSGIRFPSGRIVVNLAPADLRKEGPTYDLPIAVGIMVAAGQIVADVADCVFLGELSLEVRHAQGILPMVALARERGIRRRSCRVDAAKRRLRRLVTPSRRWRRSEPPGGANRVVRSTGFQPRTCGRTGDIKGQGTSARWRWRPPVA